MNNNNPHSHFLPLTVVVVLLLHCAAAAADDSATLKVFHVSSVLKSKPLSWAENVVQMLRKDQARLQFLSSLVARRSVAPIASARQLIQSPTYVVRAKIGTPAQTLLMALDTSNDAAWIPCSGCLGCPSATVFSSDKSSSFKPLPCNSPQCNQVPNPSLTIERLKKQSF
ncbi:aspartyl protease 25 [Momordica charantia]|uniref:Aspartyl protease 25 n=1 Tax=Momordica charantia TaxID=3673 RepID=A0A6J1CBP1_MOMCH|nr:aspartyl protease 25 [Momordica charantia]